MGQTSLRFATEVRHSLHSMLGFLELAMEEPLSERQLTYLSQCRTGADRLLRIAGDLWELSQPVPLPQTWSSFEIGAAVSEVAGVARVFAERKGLVLECDLPAGRQICIQGPRGLIQDTLRRLLDNAVQFTENGKVSVSADVCVDTNGAALLLDVADTGCGIPEDLLATFRSKDEMLPGRGLGLAIVRQRVAKMNGDISIVSTPGAGTIVRLTIPVPLATSEQLQNCRRASQNSGRVSLRILVVEDSDDSFLVLEGYVRGEGHELIRAYDGAQAIEMIQACQYDLVVMDANMPVMDGYSATRAIREWESSTSRSERTPILLFSADDPLKQAKLGGAAGCSGYLAKPATKAEVLKALNFFVRPEQPALQT